MKKLFKNLMMLTAVGTMAFLYSCGEDEEPLPVAAPTVTATAAAATYDVGAEAAINFSWTAAGGLGGVQYTITIGDDDPGATVSLDISTIAGNTEGQNELRFNVTEAMAGATVTVDITVADQTNPEAQTASDAATFTVNVPATPAKILTARMLAAPTGDNNSMTFYSIRLDQLYSQADVLGTTDPVSADIDLAYYYGANDNATLVSPDQYPSTIVDLSAWGTRNVTNLQLTTITDEVYMGITSVEAVTETVDGITFDDDNAVTNLAVGDILAFQTTDETDIKGLIKVTAINGTDGAGDNIEIELVTSQPAED